VTTATFPLMRNLSRIIFIAPLLRIYVLFSPYDRQITNLDQLQNTAIDR
jgi:hypothetical protein